MIKTGHSIYLRLHKNSEGDINAATSTSSDCFLLTTSLSSSFDRSPLVETSTLSASSLVLPANAMVNVAASTYRENIQYWQYHFSHANATKLIRRRNVHSSQQRNYYLVTNSDPCFEQVRAISTCRDSSNLLEAGRRQVRSWSRTCRRPAGSCCCC